MKKINIAYWICISLLSVSLAIGSLLVLVQPESGEPIIKLGYPAYLVPFLAVARLLGISAILFARPPLLKEWAYAGIAFDLMGALYSNMAFGTPVSHWAFGLGIPIVLLAGSYLLYHKKLVYYRQAQRIHG
jgi:hypothetical protein